MPIVVIPKSERGVILKDEAEGVSHDKGPTAHPVPGPLSGLVLLVPVSHSLHCLQSPGGGHVCCVPPEHGRVFPSGDLHYVLT